MTAVSVSGSEPSTVALAREPSSKETVMSAPSPAAAITCSLVRIWPSEDSTMPEPEPPPWPLRTSMRTTEGSTVSATSCTEPGSSSPSGVSTTSDVVTAGSLPDEAGSSSKALQAAAPPNPAAPPTTSEAATTAAANPLRPRAGGAVGAAAGAGGTGACAAVSSPGVQAGCGPRS